MTAVTAMQGNIVPFHVIEKRSVKPRKVGLNKNREGSIRNINGKIYLDFIYLEERIREFSGLYWDRENAKETRQQMDKIALSIKSGTFRFADVFPQSKKKEYFREKENQLFGYKKTPDQLLFKDYVWVWYNRLKESGRVTPRTLFGYKNYINSYLMPFFGNMSFSDLGLTVFEKFIIWSKQRCYKGKSLANETLNKTFVPLKMICKSATNEYRWEDFSPFFGFKKLPEGDAYEKIMPFSITEQNLLIEALPDHWKPYFLFAFRSGLRQGEQIGLKITDVDWENRIVRIQRAITKDEDGKKIEGNTKNRFSRRSIKLTPSLYEALEMQKTIYNQFKGEYFFCSTEGEMIHPPNLGRRVWRPALDKAKLHIRKMMQTRHSFATVALSCGESPLWLAKVMGHRDTNMIIRVYSKYVENANGSNDGYMLDGAYRLASGNNEDE